jgi:DNA topoisomerase-3
MEKIEIKGKLYGKEVTVQLDVVGKCPLCEKGFVYEGSKAWGCTEFKNGCKLTIWKEIAGKEIDENIVKQLIEKEYTDWISGFTSKKGNKFEARLTIDKLNSRSVFYSEEETTED